MAASRRSTCSTAIPTSALASKLAFSTYDQLAGTAVGSVFMASRTAAAQALATAPWYFRSR